MGIYGFEGDVPTGKDIKQGGTPRRPHTDFYAGSLADGPVRTFIAEFRAKHGLGNIFGFEGDNPTAEDIAKGAKGGARRPQTTFAIGPVRKMLHKHQEAHSVGGMYGADADQKMKQISALLAKPIIDEATPISLARNTGRKFFKGFRK